MDDRIAVHSLIKRGGMAEVYLATLRGAAGFGRQVALKCMLPRFAESPQARTAFEDESRILSQLSHSGIANIIDFGEIDGKPFQLLELVDGKDLTEFPKPIDAHVALHVAVEVAHTLDYVHAAMGADGRPLHVVHRDISQGNVLVGWNGDIKIVDFGIARASEIRQTRTRVGDMKGKWAYSAPEQVQSGAVDGRADVFALGCLLHALLVGRTPLQDRAARERVLAGGECALDVRIDEGIRAVIARACARNVDARYPRARDLASACAEVLAERGVRDGRSVFLRWLESQRGAGVVEASSHPLDALFDLAALAGPAPANVRRFTVVRPQGAPEDEEESSGGTSLLATVVAARPGAFGPGDAVRGYRIVEPLRADVGLWTYLARHEVLDKLALMQICADPEAVVRVQRFREAAPEAIAPISDVGRTPGGDVFVIVDRPEGVPVSELERTTAEVATSVARQVYEALGALEAAGVRPPAVSDDDVFVVMDVAGPRVRIRIAPLDPGAATIPAPDRVLGDLTAEMPAPVYDRAVRARTWRDVAAAFAAGAPRPRAWVPAALVASALVIGAAAVSFAVFRSRAQQEAVVVPPPPPPPPSTVATPVVTPRVVATDAPSPEPPPLPEPPEPSAPLERQRSRPRPGRAAEEPPRRSPVAPSSEDLARAVRRTGLDADVLALDPRMRPVLNALKSGVGVDDGRARLDAFDPDAERIGRHLDVTGALLSKLSGQDLGELETRFLDLRTRSTRRMARAERVALAREAVALRRAVSRATTTPPR